MKKFAGKNQLIITALAVLIAVAGYLNFTGQEIDKNGLKSGIKADLSVLRIVKNYGIMIIPSNKLRETT